MRMTKRQLKIIIREEYSRLKRRTLIKESSGLPQRMEQDIIDQYETSLKELDGGFEIEIPNAASTIESAKEFLQLRFGIDPQEYMEEEDGDVYIIYSYGDPGDDFDEELV